MTVGERIKNRRIELGLTQTDLAKRMGYRTKSAISRVESDGNNITTSRVSKFAEALNCTASYLMGWEEDEAAKQQGETLARVFIDNELMDHVTKLSKLPDSEKQLVFNMIDTLFKKGE